MAEARTGEQGLLGNKWKMRLIGSMAALPTPQRQEVQSSFHTREIRDYYVPQENKVMLRLVMYLVWRFTAKLIGYRISNFINGIF